MISKLVIAWYRRAPWSDEELAEKINVIFNTPPLEYQQDTWPIVREILVTLGDVGQRVLEEWDRKSVRKNQSKNLSVVQ